MPVDAATVLGKDLDVAVPVELVLIAEHETLPANLPLGFACRPLRLAGGVGWSRYQPSGAAKLEKAITAMDPDLAPLLALDPESMPAVSALFEPVVGRLGIRGPQPARHGGQVLCYRLSELRRGRTTVYGVDRGGAKAAVRRGESLSQVMYEHCADRMRLYEWECRQPWNYGFGAVDDRFVASAHRTFTMVDEVRGRFATSLRAGGATPREVLRACYGVDFPDEFIAFTATRAHGQRGDAALFRYAERRKPGARRRSGAARRAMAKRRAAAERRARATRFPATFTGRAWSLATLPDGDGPGAEPMTDAERWVIACDPYLVPVAVHQNGLTLCYRVDELAAGRSTVFGLYASPGSVTVDPHSAERLGEDLVTVLGVPWPAA
jgi:hypothetical protein